MTVTMRPPGCSREQRACGDAYLPGVRCHSCCFKRQQRPQRARKVSTLWNPCGDLRLVTDLETTEEEPGGHSDGRGVA